MIVNGRGTVTQQKERFTNPNEVSDLRRKLDNTIRFLGFRHQMIHIDRENDSRRAALNECPSDRAQIACEILTVVGAVEGLGIYAFQDGQPIFSNLSDKTDWAKRSSNVINQEKERDDASETEQAANKHDQLGNCRFDPIERFDFKDESKYKKTDDITNDVIVQQSRCDYPRSVLTTCNLDSDKKRSESENY